MDERFSFSQIQSLSSHKQNTTTNTLLHKTLSQLFPLSENYFSHLSNRPTCSSLLSSPSPLQPSPLLPLLLLLSLLLILRPVTLDPASTLRISSSGTLSESTAPRTMACAMASGPTFAPTAALADLLAPRLAASRCFSLPPKVCIDNEKKKIPLLFNL